MGGVLDGWVFLFFFLDCFSSFVLPFTLVPLLVVGSGRMLHFLFGKKGERWFGPESKQKLEKWMPRSHNRTKSNPNSPKSPMVSKQPS